MPIRVEVMVARRITPSFTEPKNSFTLPRVSPQSRQNTPPVGPMVGPIHHSGRSGDGPSRFVLTGAAGGVEHVHVGPHPSLAPSTIRFTSSLQVGPFWMSHSRPLSGSNARPIEFRIPYAQTRLPGNGLSEGTAPLAFMRRIFPASTFRFWELAGLVASPMTTYSLLSGPNRMRPPLWVCALTVSLVKMTFMAVPVPPWSVSRMIWFVG